MFVRVLRFSQSLSAGSLAYRVVACRASKLNRTAHQAISDA